MNCPSRDDERFMYRMLNASEIDPGLFIMNARLVDRDRDASGAVFARNGKIVAVYEGEEAVRIAEEIEGTDSGCGGEHGPGLPEVIDARGATLMPAFVDLHAHFRDPGMTQKEDLETASRAACAGGYGTVVLMANTNPVVSTAAEAAEINGRARDIGLVETFQAVSLTRGFGGTDTGALDALDPASVPVASEDGRDVADDRVMLEAMKKCAKTGVLVSCHCEDGRVAAGAKEPRASALAALREGRLADARAFLAGAESILREAEDSMTERNLALAAEAGCRVNITHASTSLAIESVRRAKERGALERGVIKGGGENGKPSGLISCDVTPHHLSLTAELCEIVNPPLRSERDRQALIAGILDGTVDAIATDHAPHTAQDKAAGAPGFSGIQTAFSACCTALVETGIINLSRLSALMSANPASLLGLRRGLLCPGYDADLVLVDPRASYAVETGKPSTDGFVWYSKSANSPFAGKTLRGKVLATFKGGRQVFGGRL